MLRGQELASNSVIVSKYAPVALRKALSCSALGTFFAVRRFALIDEPDIYGIMLVWHCHL